MGKQVHLRDDRKREAVRYYYRGWSLRKIGKLLDVSHETVRKYLQEAMPSYRYESDEEIADQRSRRLAQDDDLIETLHPNLVTGDTKTLDWATVVAYDKARERETKLLGLDEPKPPEQFSKKDVAVGAEQRVLKILEGIDPEVAEKVRKEI